MRNVDPASCRVRVRRTGVFSDTDERLSRKTIYRPDAITIAAPSNVAWSMPSSNTQYPKTAAHIICAYGATKAALDRYTQGLAHEVATDGVYVNTLAPENIVLTSGADYVRDIARRNPDMAEPVEVMAEAKK